MKFAISVLVFSIIFASTMPIFSSTLPTWSGPTEYACDGRCPQEEALALLNDNDRALIMVAKAQHPTPTNITLKPGDVFTSQSFFNEAVFTSNTLTLVVVHADAKGWEIAPGVWWVLVEACQNWNLVTLLDDADALPTDMLYNPRDWASNGPNTNPYSRDSMFTSIVSLVVGDAFIEGDTFTYTSVTTIDEGDTITVIYPPVNPEPPVTPSPVPLPAAGWLMLAGLAGLFAVKKGRK